MEPDQSQVSGTWTITRLAGSAGVRPDTIRYYERIGLLPPPARTSGDHRRYDPSALDRLQFIQGGQRLGLRLGEIAELLAIRDTGACPCEPAAGLLRRHIGEVGAEIRRLSRLRSDLQRTLAAIPAEDCPDPLPGSWRPRT